MKVTFFALLALVSISFSVGAEVEEAHCLVRGTDNDPDIRGTITFTKNGNDVDMVVDVWGITENVNASHGIHIHQYGDLSSPSNGASAGGHFAPLFPNHGCPPSTDRHLGDTGNWEVSENGTISQTKTLNLLTLTGANSIIGRAVVIHSDTDDCVTVASSQARLAWCVIGIKNPGAGNQNKAWNAYPDTSVTVCDLQPTQGSNVTGRVWFQKDGNMTTVTARITGMSGTHGFHIHEFGDLSSTAGLNTGGHYNPEGSTHGIPDYTPRHVGDMGNIFHYVDGVAYYNYTHDLIQVVGTNNVIGRAVIVHSQTDDCTQPVGNAGSRLAQCVIGITQNTVTPTDLPNIPGTQDSSACEVDDTTTEDNTADSGASMLTAGLLLSLAALLVL